MFASSASCRLVDVQMVDRRGYSQLGHDQAARTVIVPAQRGSVLDRNGNELAVSVDDDVDADPQVITDPAGDAAKLAPIVGVDEATLRARLADKNEGFVYVARQVDPNVAAAVRKLDLPGIGYEPEPKRYDPANPLAAPLLGFVGTDNTGLAGIEAEPGVDARRTSRAASSSRKTRAGRRSPNGTHEETPARQGADVQLTIDESMQYDVEQALTSEVVQDQAKGGMAVLADTRTGDVLAMASVDAENGATPAGPSSAVEREPAAHRRVRARLDREGGDDRRRDPGRDREPDHRAVGPGRDHRRRRPVRGRRQRTPRR